MQGTVREFRDETRSGSVVLDDGTVFPLPAEAFTASGLLTLRQGQRVAFDVHDGTVAKITLATF